MAREEKRQLVWVKLYEQTKDAGLTLRKWWRSYKELGEKAYKAKAAAPIIHRS